MSTELYPRFLPPDKVAAKSHRDWSKKEAQIYFDWLMESSGERVCGLLRFVGKDGQAQRNRQLLRDVGERIVALLTLDEYSRTRDGSRTLTDAGYALAADMGLLTAEVLQAVAGASVQWAILRKPKSDISYNLPVLTGFGKLILDPVGGSVAEATGVLAGLRESDAWVRIVDFWSPRAK